MKNTVFLALMVLAVLPAPAQKAATPNCSLSSETSSALAKEYAASVDGLLRDAHASLQKISEAVEAGSMSNQQAQKLKLAVTRDMISRLDAMSAVYDARLNSNDRVAAGSKNDASATNKTDRASLNTYGTVSVDELRGESDAALVTTRTEEVTR